LLLHYLHNFILGNFFIYFRYSPSSKILLLKEILEKKDPQNHRILAKILGECGSKAIPLLLQIIKREFPCDLPEYEIGLAFKTIGSESVSSLLPLLQESDKNIPYLVLRTFQNMGSLAQSAVPSLIALLQSPQEEAKRSFIVAVLGAIQEVEQSIPALVACLQDPKESVRLSASRALGSYQDKASLAVAKMLSLLEREESTHSSENINDALAKIKRASLETLPELLHLLETAKKPETLKRVAWFLGTLGEKAKAATPLLIQRLQHPNPYVQASVIEALGKIEAQEAIPFLEPFLKVEEWYLQKRAESALQQIRKK
jgi:HEAT repeat protein